MKRILILLGMVFSMMLECHAQNNNKQKSAFDEWRQAIHEDFDTFRNQIMEEYATFVENPWKEFKEQKPEPLPKDDKTPPVVIPEDKKIPIPVEPTPIKIDEIVDPLPVIPQPQPVEPIEEVPVVVESYVETVLYGTPVSVRFDQEQKIRLTGISESDVANAFRQCANENNNNTIVDCLNLRDKYQLCDWAYLKLLEKVSETAYGMKCNEATIFMAYLYMQSGYKMRLGSDGNKLYLLYASKHLIYDVSYFYIDGENYYGLDMLPAKLKICQAQFPNENSLSLIINKEPLFEVYKTDGTDHKSSMGNEVVVNMKANKNRLDFYSSYPTSRIGDNVVSRWAMYANMPMPADVASQVYKPLNDAIRGLSQIESVNYILNWVQTGFVYEYDDKVWGDDRAFFPEESLYYPYCDCEDRSILITRIVRDLLGLQCILVYYPGHLAAAVEFTQTEPNGDYIAYNGRKFFITDATILSGAPVGITMRGQNNATAKVILLD